MNGSVLEGVSDTARWVAYYRALESDRPDALFHDPLARRLAGERGEEMARTMAKLALPWAIAVRTKVYDELILDAIEQDEATLVVNLAAGMDARPYRLKLPPKLRWVEMDLPRIVEEKNRLLTAETASCAVESVAVDLTDRGALESALSRVVGGHSSVVVIAEGVLVYLEEEVVAALARSLHAHAAIRSWVLEAALPEIIERNQRAWGKQFEKRGAAMRFAPPQGILYFEEHGWTVRTRRSCLLEARRLHREPQFAGMLHFMKSLTAAGREWLDNLVVYGVVERAAASSGITPGGVLERER